MRIGMILDRPFPPDDRVEKEARSLIVAGHELYLLCFKHGKEAAIEEYQGIHVRRVFMPRWLFKKLSALNLVLPFYKRFWYKHIVNFLELQKIDVLHIHDLPLVGVALKIKEQFKIPVVADMHENYPVFLSESKFANTLSGKIFINKQKWYSKEQEWLNQADRIVVVVDGMKERLKKVLEQKNNFTVVPNCPLVDLVKKAQKALPEIHSKFKDDFVVFYFGGLDSRRGLDDLLEAAAQLKAKITNLKIVIVGEGSYKKFLLNKIQMLQLTDWVVFEGWQPTHYLKSYLDVSDVCVIPHLKSPQWDNSSPNKLYLYMIFKRPIVTSNCLSIQNIIEREKCGLVYESGNAAQLAEKILYLYQNPEQGIEMGQRGARAVTEKYDWNIKVQQLINMYKEMDK